MAIGSVTMMISDGFMTMTMMTPSHFLYKMTMMITVGIIKKKRHTHGDLAVTVNDTAPWS